MIKPYLSWSEYSCYLEDVQKYYRENIMGVKDPQTPKMLYGNIIHSAIEHDTPEDELGAELKESNFTVKDIRIANDLVKVAPRAKHREVKLYVEPNDLLSCGQYFILDGLDDSPSVLVHEYKTTGSAWREQDDVDSSGQITQYLLGLYQAFGVLAPLRLHRLDTKTGKLKTFETTRTPGQLVSMAHQMNEVVKELKERGWWQRRQMKSTWYLDEAKKNIKLYAKIFNQGVQRPREGQQVDAAPASGATSPPPGAGGARDPADRGEGQESSQQQGK